MNYDESFLPTAFALWSSLADNLYHLHAKRKEEIMQDSIVATANLLTKHNNTVRWGRIRESPAGPPAAQDETIADIVARTQHLLSVNEKRRRNRIESGYEPGMYYAWRAGRTAPNGPYTADEDEEEESRLRERQRDAAERARLSEALREQNAAFLDSV